MQVVLGDTLSCLHRVLEVFYMSTDTMVQNFLLVLRYLSLFH